MSSGALSICTAPPRVLRAPYPSTSTFVLLSHPQTPSACYFDRHQTPPCELVPPPSMIRIRQPRPASPPRKLRHSNFGLILSPKSPPRIKPAPSRSSTDPPMRFPKKARPPPNKQQIRETPPCAHSPLPIHLAQKQPKMPDPAPMLHANATGRTGTFLPVPRTPRPGLWGGFFGGGGEPSPPSRRPPPAAIEPTPTLLLVDLLVLRLGHISCASSVSRGLLAVGKVPIKAFPREKN